MLLSGRSCQAEDKRAATTPGEFILINESNENSVMVEEAAAP